MRSSFILAAAILAPAPLLADSWSLHGCGTTFGTCAAAEVTAQQLANGRWELSVTVYNLSHDASTEAYRNSLLTELRFDEVGRANWLGATTSDGQDISNNFRVRPGGGPFTVQGYTEQRDGGQVVWRKQAGSISPDCAADPACAALTPSDTDGQRFAYYTGPITFRFEVDEWSDASQIAVFQGRIGGEDGQEEAYWLERQPTNVVPEPGTMSLLAAGLAGLALKRRRKAAATVQ